MAAAFYPEKVQDKILKSLSTGEGFRVRLVFRSKKWNTMEHFGTVSIVKKINLKRTDKTLSVLYSNPFSKFVYILFLTLFAQQRGWCIRWLAEQTG
jgi:hypothetical protein